jgi:L-fuconolactonase
MKNTLPKLIVDSHQHFWDPEVGDYPWLSGALEPIRRRFGPEDLRPALRKCGVDRTVVVQTRASIEETRDLLDLASRTDFLAGVIGWVDLVAPDAAATIAGLRESAHGRFLVGLRHQVHDEPDPRWLLRPEVERGIAACGRAGLVYDLLVRPRELPAALELVERHGDVTFVIDHIAKPPIASGQRAEWEARLRLFAPHPNVHCKLSGMVTEADWQSWTPVVLESYVDAVLGWFGPGRVMFGSDWPVCLVAGSYQQVFDALCYCIRSLPAPDQERVFGGNAISVYGLAAS